LEHFYCKFNELRPSIDILGKLAAYYALTIDDIVNYDSTSPKPIVLEDKTSAEQIRLIAQLN
jgi:hypothetical protein